MITEKQLEEQRKQGILLLEDEHAKLREEKDRLLRIQTVLVLILIGIIDISFMALFKFHWLAVVIVVVFNLSKMIVSIDKVLK